MRRIHPDPRPFACAVLALATYSCGTHTAEFDTGDGGAGVGQGAGDADAGSVDFGDGAGTGCEGAPNHCSSDLHSLLDCNGNVVTRCAADEGCGSGGKCVPACQAAHDNRSTIGCDYLDFDPMSSTNYVCFAVYVVNTWTTEVGITVEFDGQTLDAPTFTRIPHGSGASMTYGTLNANGTLPPGEVGIVFLQSYENAENNCPLTGANPPGTTFLGTGIRNAFRISTTAPVVAYDISPYGGGNSAVTSASLLLPTSTWDTSYVAVAPWPYDYNTTYPQTVIVGLEDATTVQIVPSADIVGGGGLAAAPKGSTALYTVNQGEVLQFEQQAELTGSAIQADKPVGLWGTQECINIDACCCDSAHQQLPPVRALGHEYAGVRYRNRVEGTEETPPWRIVGAVNGTTLTYEPPPPPPGAPTALNLGDVVSFRAGAPFVVRSQDDQHPFYLAAYMTGAGDYTDRGDAEFVNVIPTLQYMTSYVFFTDPTYPETDLLFVRGKAGDGTFKDVTLDCTAGPVQGWLPIGDGGQYEYTRFDLVRHDFQTQDGCDNGRHQAASDEPFGLMVWAWGTQDTDASFNTTYVSYAYPAGASVKPINQVTLIK
jgi:hypothetical protein